MWFCNDNIEKCIISLNEKITEKSRKKRKKMYEEKNLNFTLNQQTLASTIIKRIRKEEIEPKFIYLPSGIPNITSHL